MFSGSRFSLQNDISNLHYPLFPPQLNVVGPRFSWPWPHRLSPTYLSIASGSPHVWALLGDIYWIVGPLEFYIIRQTLLTVERVDKLKNVEWYKPVYICTFARYAKITSSAQKVCIYMFFRPWVYDSAIDDGYAWSAEHEIDKHTPASATCRNESQNDKPQNVGRRWLRRMAWIIRSGPEGAQGVFKTKVTFPTFDFLFFFR